MKIIQNIVGALLGALFIFASVSYFFELVPMPPPPPEGTPPAMFAGAFMTTGYMDFVKALELLGGILVAVPVLRVLGLLILTPIIVNILAFHAFITAGVGLVGAPLAAGIAAIFLIWSHRKGVAALLADRG